MALYGPQWTQIVPLVQLLSIAAALQGIKAIGPRVLLAVGRERDAFVISVLYLVLLVPVLAIAAPRGLLTLATVWTVVGGAVHLSVLGYGAWAAGASPLAVWRPIARPLAGSIAMAGIVWGVAQVLPEWSSLGRVGSAWVRTGLLVVLGAVLYAAWVWLVEPETTRAAISWLKKRIGSRRRPGYDAPAGEE